MSHLIQNEWTSHSGSHTNQPHSLLLMKCFHINSFLRRFCSKQIKYYLDPCDILFKDSGPALLRLIADGDICRPQAFWQLREVCGLLTSLKHCCFLYLWTALCDAFLQQACACAISGSPHWPRFSRANHQDAMYQNQAVERGQRVQRAADGQWKRGRESSRGVCRQIQRKHISNRSQGPVLLRQQGNPSGASEGWR